MTLLLIDAGAVLLTLALFGAALWGLGFGRDYFDRRINGPLALRLHRAFVFVERQWLLCICVGLFAGAFVLTALFGARLLPAVAVGALCGAIPVLLVSRIEHRRRRRFGRQLPDLMALLAANLRSGASLIQSVVSLSADLPAPMRQEIELLLREHRLGVPFEDALIALERRMRSDETVLFCTALRVSHVSGGDLAVLLDAMADASRQRQRIESRIAATTAQGRLQAWIMCALPLLVAAALWLVEPDFLRPLWSTSSGLAVCGAIAMMLLVGVLLLRRIVAIDV